MPPTTDLDLLRSYAENRSEAAFSEIVRRHLNLVYSAALRIVGNDAHLAEDVAQLVFCDLASRVATSKSALREVRSLAGWLYQNACFTASKAVRSEQRRHFREQEAYAMNELDDRSATDAEWNGLRPVVDAAMLELGDQDREAVMLRFFDRPSRDPISPSLWPENAARMRIERALGRLRDHLKRRGVTSAVSGLGAVLTQQGIVAAPSGLAASITAASLASAVSTTLSATATFEILMASTKVKIGIAALVAAGVTTPLVLEHQRTSRLENELAALRQKASESDQLRAEVDHLTAEARASESQRAKERAELARLRGELTVLKARASKPLAVTQSSGPSTRPPTDTANPAIGKLVPAAEWKNVGFQIPSATVQTLEWAKIHGDTNIIFNAIAWGDDQSRSEVEAIFAAAPEPVRARYGSADAYVASLFNTSGPTDDRHTLTSYRILDEKVVGDEAILTLEHHYADGSTPTGPRRYVHVGGEWRQALDFDAPSVGKMNTSLQAEGQASEQPFGK